MAAAAKIRFEGLDELAAALDVDVDEAVEVGAERAAERIKDVVAKQGEWGRGSWTHPVDSGTLRRSGEAVENTVFMDVDYAVYIEARGGFFRPIVEERGPVIFGEEIGRALDEQVTRKAR